MQAGCSPERLPSGRHAVCLADTWLGGVGPGEDAKAIVTKALGRRACRGAELPFPNSPPLFGIMTRETSKPWGLGGRWRERSASSPDPSMSWGTPRGTGEQDHSQPLQAGL